jgi:cardiolipin synthase
LFRNLPNLLTGARLVLIPFIVQSLWYADYRRSVWLLWVAGVTDLLDGYLARRFQWTSRFGSYLDPIGDKLMLVSVYVTLGLSGTVPRWLMWLVLGRDALILTMVAIALLFTTVRSFPPSRWGKLSTVVQVMGALIIIATRAYFPDRSPLVEGIVVPATAVATVGSGLHYVWLAGVSVVSLASRSKEVRR